MRQKRTSNLAIFAVAGALLLACSLAQGQVPQKVSYQGLLMDDTDQPLANELVDIDFRIYDALSGGSELWSETHSTMTNSIGVVSVTLGEISPIDIDFSGPLWLEVEVNGDTLTPRRELTGSPYAFLASDSNMLGGLDASAYALGGHDHDADYVNVGEPDAVTPGMVAVDMLSSLDGVSSDGGDIDLVAGSNVTITPDDSTNTITISASGTGGGDITSVEALQGLAGGGTTGDVGMSVGAGDGIDVTTDAISLDVTDIAGEGLGEDTSNNLEVNVGTGLEVASDVVQLTSSYSGGNAYDARFVNEGQSSSVTISMVAPSIVSSIDGVTNDGGDINLVAGSNVTITPDDGTNTITISASGTGGGDITSVEALQGLTGGGTTGDVGMSVGAGDGIDVTTDAISLDVTDIAGEGLGEDASNNLEVNVGTGLELAADVVQLTSSYSGGNAYDARFVNEGQSGSVTASMVAPSIVSSIDGVTNDGGDIDLVAGANITITPNDGGNKITIAADGTGAGDITSVDAGQGLVGGGTSGDVTVAVGAGNGIVVGSDAVSLAPAYGDGSAHDGRFVNEQQADSVTGAMIVNGEVTNADIAVGASIAPSKISGTAWTSTNDGSGSGLDADRIDGQQATDFAAAGHDHDTRYFTESELGDSDGSPPNTGSNRVSWDNLVNVPAGFADGSDDGEGGTSGLWTATGSDVYRASGSVGIGTTNPGSTLDVRSHGLYGAYFESDYLDAPDNTHAVHGEYTGAASIPDGVGVCGLSVPGDGYGIGGVFEGGYMGVYGSVSPTGNDTYIAMFGSTESIVSVGSTYGIYGKAERGATSYGSIGLGQDAASNYGVQGFAFGGNYSYGVYGSAGNSATENWAGWFDGEVNITGTVHRAADGFRIDHPLDPAGKYLSHSSVESSDRKNVYDGVVLLDGSGGAWVELPDWFEALNGDFRYQLTAIGAPGPNLYVAEKIKENRFKIAGGQPGAEVCWMVTGIRHDAYASGYRLEVEKIKTPDEMGRYVHPELYGLRKEAAIGYVEPFRPDSER